MTRREIEKALPFWKGLLRLEDWRISVDQSRKKYLVEDGVDCLGYNHYSSEEMESIIGLARGANEATLVHELLHLVLDGDRPGQPPYDVLHERAINRCAEALVTLARSLPSSRGSSVPWRCLVTDEVDAAG